MRLNLRNQLGSQLVDKKELVSIFPRLHAFSQSHIDGMWRHNPTASALREAA